LHWLCRHKQLSIIQEQTLYFDAALSRKQQVDGCSTGWNVDVHCEG
jgi:hypothetical protein